MFQIINSQIISSKAQKLFGLLNQSVPFLIGIYIFFNPFPHTTSIKEICFYLSIFIVFVLLLFKKIEFSFNTPLTFPFALFVLWAFFSIFFAVDKENSIHDFYSHLIRYIILYFILINFFGSKKYIIVLSRIIIISAITFALFGLFYFYGVMDNDLSMRFGYGRGVGFLENKAPGNTMCVVIIFSILLLINEFIRERSLILKLLFTACLIPQFVLVFLTQSRGGLIALFLSISVLMFNKKKKTVLVFLIASMIIVAFFPVKNRLILHNLKNEIRIGMIYTAIEVIKDYPIIGIGFGNLTYGEKIDLNYYNDRIPEKFKQKSVVAAPHNIFLNIAVRLGLIGLAIFLYMIFILFKICWDCIKYGKNDFIREWGICITSACIAFIVIGMFEQMFSHMPEVVFFTIFSMATIIWRLNVTTDVFDETHQCLIEKRV